MSHFHSYNSLYVLWQISLTKDHRRMTCSEPEFLFAIVVKSYTLTAHKTHSIASLSCTLAKHISMLEYVIELEPHLQQGAR